MNRVFIFIIFIFSLLFLQSQAAKSKPTDPPKVSSRFKSIRCSADNATIVIKFCFLKAISRKVVTANVGVKILTPLNKINIQFILNYRYGLIFRPVIDTKPQDWCAIMKGANPNPYIKLFLDTLKDSTASGIHECPYVDDFDANNVTLNYDRVHPTAIFPEGTYRIMVVVFKGKDEILRIELDEEVKSPLRETFG